MLFFQSITNLALPSPPEVERRFGPSFIDFFNRVVMPELKKWDEVGSMTEQEKVNAIIGIIIRENFQSVLKDADEKHYLTFVEIRVRLYETETRADVIPATKYTEIDKYPPRILRPPGDLVPGTVFNPGFDGAIHYKVNERHSINILIEFNYLFNQ